MDASDLTTFSDNQCSGAYICWVLEHMIPERSNIMLKELRRVIAPNGIVIINEGHHQPKESIVASFNGGDYPFTKKFFYALVQFQSEKCGNANYGEQSNMTKSMEAAWGNNFQYTRKALHNLNDPVWQHECKEWFFDLIQNILPMLVVNNKFEEAHLTHVLQEIQMADDFQFWFGNVIAWNTK